MHTRYLREIANALEYCHSCGVLHLDVKPKNMIINLSSNSCKLCDFGSSVHVSETRMIHSPTKVNDNLKWIFFYSLFSANGEIRLRHSIVITEISWKLLESFSSFKPLKIAVNEATIDMLGFGGLLLTSLIHAA